MKSIKLTCLVVALFATSLGYSQFLDKLGEKAERAVERTVERRVERETEKSTDRALDSVIEAPKKTKKEKRKAKKKKKKSGNVIGGEAEDDNTSTKKPNDNSENLDEQIEIQIVFRHEDRILIFDAFEKRSVGESSIKWSSIINSEKKFFI